MMMELQPAEGSNWGEGLAAAYATIRYKTALKIDHIA